ncbi:MAG: SMC family ATPase [Candidatus Aenigmarchaeota archaeon]|nr:SMC family ATPase [Candidatus Aenigmarchaeota archaeon]
MIRKVKLQNWKSHLDTELVFDRGTNVFIGPMGSGKTSVLDAICFAFFGTFPTLFSKKIKLDDVIMNRPVEKQMAKVSVTFEVDREEYTITRVVERGKGTTYSELRKGDKLLEAPNTQRVTELVEEILKIDYDLFTRAIYSEQNALDYFLRIPKGQRKKKMDELLMLDKLEKARATCVSVVNRLVDKKMEKQSMLERMDVESLKKTIRELESSVEELLKQIETLEKDLKKFLMEKKEVEEKYYQLKKLFEQKETLEKEKSRLESTYIELKKRIDNLENSLKKRSIEEVKKEYSMLTQKIEEMKKRLGEKREEKLRKSKEISELTSVVSHLKKEKLNELLNKLKEKKGLIKKLGMFKQQFGENVEDSLKKLKVQYENLLGKIQAKKERIKLLEDGISKLSLPVSKCPVCDSELTPEKKSKLLEQKKNEKGMLEKELAELQDKLEGLKLKIDEMERVKTEVRVLKNKIEEMKGLEEELEAIKKEINEKESLLSKLRKELEDLEKELSDLQKSLDEMNEKYVKLAKLLDKAKELEEARISLAKIFSQLKDVKERLEKIVEEIGEESLDKYVDLLRSIEGKVKETEAKVEEMRKRLEEKEKMLEDFKTQVEKLEKERKEVERLESLIRNLKIFEKALVLTQTQMRKELVETINYTMNNLWPSLYPYGDYVEVALHIEEDDYVLKVKDRDGRWINVDGIVSGGERSIACLALRIAFARVLAPQLLWLVLDEPTHNLDAKAVDDLAETLRSRIGEFVDQVFLITHEERLEGAVTGTLYRFEREKEKNGVTKVSKILG